MHLTIYHINYLYYLEGVETYSPSVFLYDILENIFVPIYMIF